MFDLVERGRETGKTRRERVREREKGKRQRKGGRPEE